MHFYKLNFSQQIFPFNESVKLYRANLQGNNDSVFCALHNGRLHCYQYGSNTWQTLSVTDLNAQQLYFADILGNGKDILIAKTKEGIRFYQYQKNAFSLLFKSEDFEENEFHDAYDWSKSGNSIKFGQFYRDKNVVGILTHHQEYGTKFYAVMKDELLAGRYPIWSLNTASLSVLDNASQADFFLADIKRKGQENIIVYSKKGLNIYEFNQSDGLECLMEVPGSVKFDDSEAKLFFPNLTRQFYRDIVLLNSTGLFIYQYKNELSNYRFIHYHPLFSKLKGWRQEHIDSIQFKDIDLDGRQDMFFTGPKGINLLSFNNYTNQWQSLLDNSQLTIPERYSDIMKIIPANLPITTHPIIFTKHKNQLYWANIVKAKVSLEEEIESRISNETLTQISAVSVIPQLHKLQLEEEKSSLLLRDQLDYSSIINSVEKVTGKPKFNLPLIDLSNLSNNIKIDFVYNGNDKVSGVLGIGWSLPQNFIMMHHQSSIFPEDEKYYVFLQDLPQQLIFDFRNSTDTVYWFKLSNEQSDLQICYHKNEEKWEIDTKDVKQVYGRTHASNTDSIKWELTWENWRGVGSSYTGQKRLATAWYLAEVRDKKDNVMSYTYDIVNIPVPNGKNFTREIYLKTIRDNQGNKIIFSYSDKDIGEYDLLPLVDEEGNLNTQAVQTRYLKGYTVTTPIYQQEIDFVYKVENGKRLLTKIKQDSDVTNKSILQFIYKEISKSYVLEKVVLPTGANVEFSYQSIGTVSRITEELGRRYDVQKNFRLDYGNDDVLISYIDEKRQVVLRMFNQEMTEELYSSVSSSTLSRFPLLGYGSVKVHEVVRAEDFFAVVLYYKTDKELCLFYREENRWLAFPKCYHFNEDTIIKFGANFVVVANNNSFIEIIDWNKTSKQWIKKPFSSENNASLLLKASNRMFLVYDDQSLWIGYQDHNNKWRSKVIKAIPRIISDIQGTLDKFELNSNAHKQILNVFKNTALQLNNNLILLSNWKAEGAQLYLVVNLFVLDSNYGIAHEQQYIVKDDVNSFLRTIEDATYNKVSLAYEVVGDKFKFTVKDFSDPAYDTASNRKNVIDPLPIMFFQLYIKKHSIILNSQTAASSIKKFTFIGDKWKMDTVSESESKQEKLSIPLGDKFVLNRENLQSSFKLYNQGKNGEKLGNSLLDLEMKHLNQTLVRNMYPVYFAYQENNKQVGVVEFSNDGSIDKTYKLPQEEKLSFWSSYQALVTQVNNFDAERSNTLIFRTKLGIRRLLPNPVIAKLTVSLVNGNKRIIAYEYSSAKALGNTVYYEKTSLIPGSDKRSFGWIEETRDFGNQSRVEKKIFNSQGRLIKTLKLKEERTSTNETIIDNENFYLNTFLLDKTGKLEVAMFYPDNIVDEGVGYYGFEDYEVNKIGVRNLTVSDNKWLFNETAVVKQGFSLTGQNYLSLSGQILEGTFQPKNQNQEYVASCWVRTQSKMFGLGAVTPYLKAMVFTEGGDEIFGLLSEAKFQSGDWFYLEVVVDLLYAKQIYKGLNDAEINSTLTEQPNINLKTSIILSPGVNTTIDVDHVRFSPLGSHMYANVYDPKTKQVREVIHSNGLIRRHVYDKYQKQVARVNEYGQLEEFNTYTKASSIGRITQPKSNIQIQPKSGFYEDFAPYSFYERWKINNASSWQISPGQLQHLINDSHDLQLHPYDISSVSYGVRLCFSLQSESSVIKFNSNLKVIRAKDKADIVFLGKRQSVPLYGEILIVVEHSRLFVWVDGGLYFDGPSNGSLFNLVISGKVKIRDVMIFSEPSILVTYFNELGEKLQEIVLEGENTAIVTEFLYDELGRQTISTQPARIERYNIRSVLSYYPNFIINSNPYSVNSVWKTKQLQGEVSKLIGKYGYSQIQYHSNPLNEKSAVGLPGREFSISGPFAKHFDSFSENLFINNLFPVSQNYSYQVEHKPGNVEDISVFNNKNNRVAWYVHVPGNEDLLSTYEYDENDKLVKSLPPLYHEKVRTFNKLNSQLKSVSEEEKALQKSLGIHLSYDKKGKIITKTTPDSGKIENMYDTDGLLKFVVHYSNFNHEEIESVIYFDYDQLGRLSSTGTLNSPLPKEELLTLALSDNNTEKYQQFYHSDFEREPILRGKIKRTITFNDGEPLIEESILNIENGILSKRIIIPTKGNDTPLLVEINKRYVAGKLREIEYPIDVQGQPFRLTYHYNKLGNVTGIGIPEKYDLFANFAYNSLGQVSSEQHLPQSPKNFTRQYSYNSPGFLIRLEDKFLTEKVYYTEGSYGGHGYGDGTVTRTEFKATWHKYCDDSKLGLNEHSFIRENITPEESALCFRELKRAGYLNDHNCQTKVYYPALEPKLPIVCSYGITGRQIAKKLGQEGFPGEYGHSYDYGNHQELTKAKYFVGNEAPLPLQPDTFANEISGINKTVSYDIWKILKSSNFLVENNDKVDSLLSHAKRGKSFIRSTLFNDLKKVNTSYVRYELPLERLLITNFPQKQDVSLLKSNLQDAFIKWNGGVRIERVEQATNKIIEMLEKRQYLQNPLAEEFNIVLRKYQSFIPDIVRVLSQYFTKQLGEAEFDIESYGIDSNGNHKHYYTGFDRYELNYRNNTNRVDGIKFRSYASSKSEHNFSIKHDSRGNLIQALHKGIEHIDYNLVSNRANKIQLIDGKTLTFYYDMQGERVLKRVADSNGQTVKEIHYIRDEFGRALVERQITYISQALPPDVLITVYIYGPRGLLGFIRRDEFYSVITDHEGSVRLVVKGDEVVAGYDYLPYGNLMREYGSDPETHISYRYTGQEWDEEVGLYNYHSRFYDPIIGRFYQIDPKGQYFSPYKYAGNSPISMIDPDGEFAFLLLALFGLVGAYLGGAAANHNWKLNEWNYGSANTWLGIIGGGISGVLLPVGFVYSVTSFTAIGLTSIEAISATTYLGVGGIYFSTAATNNEWDPSKWDLSSPETWNAAFQGFAMGSGAAGGIRSASKFYKDLTSFGKGAFIVSSTGTGGGIFVINGFAADWDFSKPGVYFGFFDAITGAPDLPMFVHAAATYLGKYGHHILKEFSVVEGLRGLPDGPNTFKYLENLEYGHLPSKNSIQFMVRTSITVFSMSLSVMAVSENGFDFTSPNTYHAMINGMLMGGQLSSFVRTVYRKYNTNKKINNKIKLSIGVETEAKKVIHMYGNLVKEKIYDVEAQKNFNYMVKSRLEEAKIPHSALSVAITDKMTLVAFSGNNGPGLIYFINSKRKKKSQKMILLDNNSLIGGRKVVLNDDRGVNERIIRAIENKRNELKKNNIVEFKKEEQKLSEFLFGELRSVSSFTEDKIESVFTNLKSKFEEKGYIKEKEIAQILKHPLEGTIKKLKSLDVLDKKIKALKTNNEKQIKAFKEKIAKIEQQLEPVKKPNSEQIMSGEERIELLKQKVDNLIDVLNNDHFKKFFDKFTHWEPTNCAEPHVITSLSRISEIFPMQKSSNYNLKDIRYLATYKLNYDKHLPGLPELKQFPRCDNCVITTKSVKNVITDPYWSKKIDDLKLILQGLKRKGDLSQEKLYFLIPYNDMIFGLISTDETDDRASISTRERRSAFDQQTEMNVISNYGNDNKTSIVEQCNSYDSIDTSKKTTNNTAKSASFINNFFGWMKAKSDLFTTGMISSIGERFIDGKYFNVLSENKFYNSATKNNLKAVDFSQVDINGTILLADVLLAKKGKRQIYTSSIDHGLSQSQILSNTLNIRQVFEEAIKKAALKSGISERRLNIDFVEIEKMEKEINNKILRGRFDEISLILKSYAEKACPRMEKGSVGKLSPKKFNKFLAEFNNLSLDQSIQQILYNSKNNVLEDNNVQKQQRNSSLENKKLKSYLDNIATQGYLTQVRDVM